MMDRDAIILAAAVLFDVSPQDLLQEVRTRTRRNTSQMQLNAGPYAYAMQAVSRALTAASVAVIDAVFTDDPASSLHDSKTYFDMELAESAHYTASTMQKYISSPSPLMSIFKGDK